MNDTHPSGGKELPAGTRLEEFVIERVLGSGGFGITYLARDVSLNRPVVIKENLPSQFAHRDTSSLVVKPGLGREDKDNFRWSMENFSREAEMLASLHHPAIVSVLRRFEAFGTAYFVMPYVEGVPFDALIEERHRKNKPFTEEELRGLLERTLSALDHLHDRGIYHRDIKPGNILMTRDGVPVLIDFGSARHRLSERSMTVIESPGYTPFEQLQTRGNIGPWSDLYALGATLVKIMTGEAPPKTNDRSFGDPWRPLIGRSELAGRFSPGFLAGIDRALRLPIEERWQESEEWRAALREETVAQTQAATPTHEPVTVSAASESESAPGPEQITNFVPWAVAACLMLGLIAVANLTGEKEESPTATLVDEAAIQRERDRTGAAAAQAKEAEKRAARAEQERQALIAQAQAKEEEAAKAEMEKRSLSGSKAGEERDFEIAPGVRITMCWIPPGEFLMGSPEDVSGRYRDNSQHRVTLTQGFWLAKTETTQAQWQAVMGGNPSCFKGDELPVERVSWNDIAGSGGFIDKANKTASATGGRFHLPTEAQWEYACRAGTTGPYAGHLDLMAWYDQNSGGKTHPVGQKKANGWGLHDMHGNVLEWCADWFGSYQSSAVTDPQGATSGMWRALRGGSWGSYADYYRTAYSIGSYPINSENSLGFRTARSSAP